MERNVFSKNILDRAANYLDFATEARFNTTGYYRVL